ncbi:hypothetical protein BDW62DRAFT_200557 [Aspergillus aurantiobrunneus]
MKLHFCVLGAGYINLLLFLSFSLPSSFFHPTIESQFIPEKPFTLFHLLIASAILQLTTMPQPKKSRTNHTPQLINRPRDLPSPPVICRSCACKNHSQEHSGNDGVGVGPSENTTAYTMTYDYGSGGETEIEIPVGAFADASVELSLEVSGAIVHNEAVDDEPTDDAPAERTPWVEPPVPVTKASGTKRSGKKKSGNKGRGKRAAKRKTSEKEAPGLKASVSESVSESPFEEADGDEPAVKEDSVEVPDEQAEDVSVESPKEAPTTSTLVNKTNIDKPPIQKPSTKKPKASTARGSAVQTSNQSPTASNRFACTKVPIPTQVKPVPVATKPDAKDTAPVSTKASGNGKAPVYDISDARDEGTVSTKADAERNPPAAPVHAESNTRRKPRVTFGDIITIDAPTEPDDETPLCGIEEKWKLYEDSVPDDDPPSGRFGAVGDGRAGRGVAGEGQYRSIPAPARLGWHPVHAFNLSCAAEDHEFEKWRANVRDRLRARPSPLDYDIDPDFRWS